MRCRTAGRLMSRHLDQTLGPDELARFSRHLEHCERCRAAWVEMQRVHDLFRKPSLQQPPHGLVEGVLARLPEGRRAVVPLVPVWARTSLVAAAAMVVLLVGVVGLMVLLAVASGQGNVALFQQRGWSALAAVWGQFLQLLSAFGHVLGALWQALRWPWVPLLAVLVAGSVSLWVWLWRRHSRGSGLP